MKKYFAVALIALFTVSFAFTSAFAEGLPSAKAVAAAGELVGVALESNFTAESGAQTGSKDWFNVMTKPIKVSMNKDLFVDVSMETGIITNTAVVSKLLGKSTSTAEAALEVRVVLDAGPNQKILEPGAVTFDKRKQSLIAQFAGYIAPECITITEDVNGDHSVEYDEACIAPESLELLLDTLAAHSFNFVAPDVPTGVHTVTVQAKLSYNVAYTGVNYLVDPDVPDAYIGKAAASAVARVGSMAIESVRMVKDTDVTEF